MSAVSLSHDMTGQHLVAERVLAAVSMGFFSDIYIPKHALAPYTFL